MVVFAGFFLGQALFAPLEAPFFIVVAVLCRLVHSVNT
jgi:hypothetical protein